MNDLPIHKVFAKINRIGNDKFFNERKDNIIDSAIIEEQDIQQDTIIETINTNNSAPMSSIRKLAIARTGKDKDNPLRELGEEAQIEQELGEEAQAEQPSLNKTADKIIPAQSDSGANRIVTDDLALLKNVKLELGFTDYQRGPAAAGRSS